jgi:hypothetical protein
MRKEILTTLNELLPCNSFDSLADWLKEAFEQGLIDEAEKSQLKSIDTISFFNHLKIEEKIRR